MMALKFFHSTSAATACVNGNGGTMNNDLESWLLVAGGLLISAVGGWLLLQMNRSPNYHDKGTGSFSRAWCQLPKGISMTILGIGCLCAGIFGAGIGIALLLG